jgi:segregation and condensation protein B
LTDTRFEDGGPPGPDQDETAGSIPASAREGGGPAATPIGGTASPDHDEAPGAIPADPEEGSGLAVTPIEETIGPGQDAVPGAPASAIEGSSGPAATPIEGAVCPDQDAAPCSPASAIEGSGPAATPIERAVCPDHDAAPGSVPADPEEASGLAVPAVENEAAAAPDQDATPDATAASSGPAVASVEDVVPPTSREPDEAALRLAEAAVFAAVTPMTPRGLSQLLPADIDAAAVIEALRARYEGRGIELVEIGGGLQFRTAADLAPVLRKVVQVPRRLPRVALETLAIVAYHQPITRPEIEELRGAGLAQSTMDVLLENDLIVSRGRKETPGRPTLWATTPKFLEYFGLRDIRELPRRDDLLLETPRPEQGAEIRAAEAKEGQTDEGQRGGQEAHAEARTEPDQGDC